MKCFLRKKDERKKKKDERRKTLWVLILSFFIQRTGAPLFMRRTRFFRGKYKPFFEKPDFRAKKNYCPHGSTAPEVPSSRMKDNSNDNVGI
ncbi:MAG: hypothetical protein IJT27_07840 [Clostridia bacterium]|nr:hypothetical protein [Clostridia bacterium]